MIKNDKQYNVTLKRLEDFKLHLEKLKSLEMDNDPLFTKIMIEATQSQVETFNREVMEYENLKKQRPVILTSSIVDFPQLLIKARIVHGYSHKDIARMTQLKEQQIQRYEATNYEGATFQRILKIASAMNITFDDPKIHLSNIFKFHLEEYDCELIRKATKKIQESRTLLPI